MILKVQCSDTGPYPYMLFWGGVLILFFKIYNPDTEDAFITLFGNDDLEIGSPEDKAGDFTYNLIDCEPLNEINAILFLNGIILDWSEVPNEQRPAEFRE